MLKINNKLLKGCLIGLGLVSSMAFADVPTAFKSWAGSPVLIFMVPTLG